MVDMASNIRARPHRLVTSGSVEEDILERAKQKMVLDHLAGLHGNPNFAVFQGTSNGGRQFLRKRRSNRRIVPLYGKSDRLFTQGLKFETR